MIISLGKEDLSTKAPEAPEPCQVRSGTDDPCHRLASVRLWGVPFCEPCAREQEAYFAVGKLTEEPRSSHNDERLVGLLGQTRGAIRRRRIRTSSAEAA
jgi:hypothetical protein